MGAVSASLLNENCLLIALSSSGETKEIIDAVNLARENGAKSLCITSNKFSPLASICDSHLLSAGSGWSISERYNEVRMSQMLLCDTICSYIRSIIDESGSLHYYKMQKILSSSLILISCKFC
jgi:DNA-binding MurR/RpiR family transcriptional regulator